MNNPTEKKYSTGLSNFLIFIIRWTKLGLKINDREIQNKVGEFENSWSVTLVKELLILLLKKDHNFFKNFLALKHEKVNEKKIRNDVVQLIFSLKLATLIEIRDGKVPVQDIPNLTKLVQNLYNLFPNSVFIFLFYFIYFLFMNFFN